MKKLIFSLILVANSAFARNTHVHGYTRSNGTYVAPYERTTPNNTTLDNYNSYKIQTPTYENYESQPKLNYQETYELNRQKIENYGN